jgi:hypothetical protein
MIPIVRYLGDPHPALDAWLRSEKFELTEPNWTLDIHASTRAILAILGEDEDDDEEEEVDA